MTQCNAVCPPGDVVCCSLLMRCRTTVYTIMDGHCRNVFCYVNGILDIQNMAPLKNKVTKCFTETKNKSNRLFESCIAAGVEDRQPPGACVFSSFSL